MSVFAWIVEELLAIILPIASIIGAAVLFLAASSVYFLVYLAIEALGLWPW